MNTHSNLRIINITIATFLVYSSPTLGADFFGKSSKALGWETVDSGRIRQGLMASTVSNCLAGGVLLFSISVNSH